MAERQDQRVTRMVHELGNAIRQSLADSPQVTACLDRIKADGYDLSVVLEATIGFSPTRREELSSAATLDAEPGEPSRPKITPLDKKFLRSLKISVEEE
jgi:hypothetical protein